MNIPITPQDANFKPPSCGELATKNLQKMLEIPRVFRRFFEDFSSQSLAIWMLKVRILRCNGYIFKKNLVPLVITFLIMSLFYINLVNSQSLAKKTMTTVDIYGTHQLSSKIIKRKYAKEFMKIAEIMHSSKSITDPANNQLFVRLIKKITLGIQSMGKFSMINISPILYPNDPVVHFTIDVVDQNDQARLTHFLPSPTQSIQDPAHLLTTWNEYEARGFSWAAKNKKFPSYAACPAYHCLFGFDLAEFKPYAKIFITQVEKNKFALVNVLRNDKDEKKRAAAAFLLAHIKNVHELINLLVPSMDDANEHVRNNVMRVIGMALLHTKNDAVPVEKIIKVLDFPMSTDRNKGMLILLTLINQPNYADYIAKHAGKQLVKELKLQQPNNHELAYEILKKISDQHYADRDYPAWEAWLKNNAEQHV